MEQPSEDQRLQALSRYHLLHHGGPSWDVTAADFPTGGVAAGDVAKADSSLGDISDEVAALTRLAAAVTGLPLAALNIFDADHQIQLATVGAPAGISPRADSPCARHFLNRELVHVPDASRDPRFADNPYVDGRLGAIRAYASAPLVTSDGHALGTLCVADTQTRTLKSQQVSALADLSRVVIALFERRRQALLNARLAAEAEEQRDLAELLIVEAGHRSRLVEAVFDSVGVGIVVADTEGCLMATNTTADSWLGRPIDKRLPLTEHTRAYDLRTADGAHPLPTEALPLGRALREGPVDQIEMVIVSPDQPPRAVVCSARPLHAEDGTLTGAVAALHDVSLLRAREAALQVAHQQLSRHAEQAAAVARAAHAVTTAEDPRQAVCDAEREPTEAHAAFLLQPEDGRLVATATSGLPEGITFEAPLFGGGEIRDVEDVDGVQDVDDVDDVGDVGEAGDVGDVVSRPMLRPSLAGTANTSGNFLFVPDVAADPRHDAGLRAACATVSGAWQPITLGQEYDTRNPSAPTHGVPTRAVHARSVQPVSVQTRSSQPRSIGVLAVVWNHHVAELPTATQAMLSTLAGEAAATIERAALLDKLALAADHDPLTGLANRRSWDRSAEREIARAARDNSPLSFLLADLDHFKTYNDTYGHLAGDELLRHFATAAAGCLREVDVLARWGGEEFVMALPGCSGTDAVAIADRIRGCVAAGQSATIGVAEWSPGATASQVLAEADTALYQGKAAGRDLTVLRGVTELPAASPPPSRDIARGTAG